MKENEPESSDSVISRKVELEILNILDEKIPDDFYTGLQQANEGRTMLMEQIMKGSGS